MATVAEAMRIGLRHQQAGRVREAEQIYQQVLQVEPGHADALHLLGVAADQAGRAEEAVQLIREAIAVRPDQPLFRCSLGNALASLGQSEQALESCHVALDLHPDFAEAHASLGNVFRRCGQMAEAEGAFREVVRLQPNQADAHNNLGNVLRNRGKLPEAEACYRKALRLAPRHTVALANLGAMLIHLGRLDDAEACLSQAVQLQPRLAPAQFDLGLLHEMRGRLREAEECFRRVITLAPTAEVHHRLGAVLYQEGRLDAAETSFREAIRLRPDFAEAVIGLGELLRNRGDIPAARAAFEDAVRLQPMAFEARNNLATCLIEEGQPAEAVAQLQEVLRIRPGQVPALGNLGTLARDGQYQFRDEDTWQVRTLLGDPALPPEPRCTLSFALAHVLARQQEYDEAFRYYRQANDTKAELFRARGQAFDRARHQGFIEQVMTVGTDQFFRRAEGMGSPSELPVFIVGMPRSGTTLAEQILASHPQICGAGELPDIPKIGRRLAMAGSHAEGYPACLARVDAATVSALASAHLERLARLGGPAQRVIDKLPANIYSLPLIHLLFPRARIIHCVRNPLDVCLSCYFQDFYNLSFATRLEDIGFYFRAYERLAEHWRATFPGPMLELRYEDLIADTEDVSRRLVDFCGLDWDARCLRFHENRRVVRTSSVAQVRHPIYHNAVGRWERYRKHLGPLFEALGKDGEGVDVQIREEDSPKTGGRACLHGAADNNPKDMIGGDRKVVSRVYPTAPSSG